MAIASPLDSSSPTANTPTVPTVTTGTLQAIRDRIEPATGWWQGRVKTWHLLVIFASYITVIGSFIAFAATHTGIH